MQKLHLEVYQIAQACMAEGRKVLRMAVLVVGVFFPAIGRLVDFYEVPASQMRGGSK